jgi:thymidylate kinase
MKSFADRTKRGLFIVLEGVDRVGKSTQLKMLKNYFENVRNEKCEEMAFPSILKIYSRPRNQNW